MYYVYNACTQYSCKAAKSVEKTAQSIMCWRSSLEKEAEQGTVLPGPPRAPCGMEKSSGTWEMLGNALFMPHKLRHTQHKAFTRVLQIVWPLGLKDGDAGYTEL